MAHYLGRREEHEWLRAMEIYFFFRKSVVFMPSDRWCDCDVDWGEESACRMLLRSYIVERWTLLDETFVVDFEKVCRHDKPRRAQMLVVWVWMQGKNVGVVCQHSISSRLDGPVHHERFLCDLSLQVLDSIKPLNSLLELFNYPVTKTILL